MTPRRLAPLAPACAIAVLFASCALAPPAGAQPYARFAVADSVLPAALRASGGGFEASWNALLVAELRAKLARADSAGTLFSLALRVARAEPVTLGSHIASDALKLRTRWTREQWRVRVRAAVTESLAVVAQGVRDRGRADSLFRAALADYRGLGEQRRTAWVLGSLGVVAFNAADYALADSVYREALAARRALGDPRMIGASLNALGSTNFLRHRYAEAEPFLREARAVREQTGERAALGSTLNTMGLVAAALGRADSARVCYERALELTVAQGDSARTLEVLINYARLLASGGEVGRARPLQDRALALARSRGDVLNEGVLLHTVGEALRFEGRFSEATDRLREAVALGERAGNSRDVLGSLIELGRVAIQINDPAAAWPPLERALALAESLSDRGAESRALDDLAIAARLEGDLGGAARLAGRALASGEAVGDSSLTHAAAVTLGEIVADRGDAAGARAWYARAAEAGAGLSVDDRIADLLNLGFAETRLGRLDDAERQFARGAEMAEAAGTPEYQWRAWLYLGDVAERRGEDAKALALDRRAAALIDTMRSRQGEGTAIALLARRRFAFDVLVHLLGKLDPRYPDSAYAAEAFHWAERARARALLDLMARGGGHAGSVRPLTLEEARARLGSDRDALLEYSLGDSSSSPWVITRSKTARFTLPPAAVLQTRAALLRRGLADPARAATPRTLDAARALYRVLVEPAEPMLEKIERLIVSPDGALALVPFEALLREAPTRDGRAARHAFLVERFAVSYTFSAATLGAGATASGGGIVAVGDPRFGAGDSAGDARPALAPLPNTAAEVASLRALTPPRAFTALTGAEATRARLLALPALAGASVIHIATHGEANEVEPGRSGLWLAPGAGETAPGFLAVTDIASLRLSAALVTLSACETGLGRLERGEGVVGLTRAFLAAGAGSVLVSLWEVNDRSSALLMERFYRELLARDAPRAEALAKAKRALLRRAETRSPFHWAPFVLVGEPGKID